MRLHFYQYRNLSPLILISHNLLSLKLIIIKLFSINFDIRL